MGCGMPEIAFAELELLERSYRKFVKRNVLWTAVSATFLGFFGFIKEDLPQAPFEDLLGFVRIGCVLAFATAVSVQFGGRRILAWNAGFGAAGGLAWMAVGFVIHQRTGRSDYAAGFAGLGIWWLYWAFHNARAFVGWGRLMEAARRTPSAANH